MAVAKFKAAGVAQPINDARILLGHSLNKPNERFYGREEDLIKSEHLDDFSSKILRRCKTNMAFLTTFRALLPYNELIHF